MPNRNEDPRQFSFEVGEFALLDDGDRLMLHWERGFSGTTNADDIWARSTVESITLDVLTVVLPDDAEITGEDHSWEWLAELLAARGIDLAAECLSSLPYKLVLAENVHQRLDST
jgi:hypothetical protein